MRALVKPGSGPGLALRTVPVPTPGPEEILVRVEAGGICGTDLHIYNWNAWAASRVIPPRIIGHEFCGAVAASGPEVSGVAVGDFIAGESHLSCDRCRACRRGERHICERLEVLGVDRDGAFADYLVMPARNAWRLDRREIPLTVAAVMDPLGNAVHAAFASAAGGALAGRTVAIIGCGPIGLMAIGVVRLAGAAFVAASDPMPERRALAERMGADLVLAATDVPARVRAATGGEGVDVVLEMSGHPAGIRDGLRSLRNGGWMSQLGLPARPVEIDLATDVIFPMAHLQGIYGRRIWDTWEQATTLLRRGLDLSPVITHVLPLERYEEVFTLLRSGAAGKVVLTLT
jgi:threonine 3-dehydrogenase